MGPFRRDMAAPETSIDTYLDAQEDPPAEEPTTVTFEPYSDPLDGLGVSLTKSFRTGDTLVCMSRGSVIDFCGDAIVNAANTGGLGGGGVDGAVNHAGGLALQAAREDLPTNDNGQRIETGGAVITVGGDLSAKWCIHAVGPAFGYDEAKWPQKEAELASAHTKTLELAKQHGVAAIGFSLLSAGIFRGGKELRDVLKISCTSVKEAVYPGLQAQQCDLPNLKLDAGCNIGGSYD